MHEIPIDEIVVGTRFRKELGNLVPLMRSMDTIGLLHPIVLDPHNKLIAGLRRLECARSLGWETIKAVTVDSLEDAAKRLAAEHDENECREAFRPSEGVAIGKALEELERPKAKERQKAGQETSGKRKGSEKFTEPIPVHEKGDTRDKIGKAIGMSGPTYQRAKAVVNAAEEDPETFGPIADEMDRTGKVMGAFNKVQAIKGGGKRKPKKPANSKPRFREETFDALCDQIESWLQERFDRAGGATSRDACRRELHSFQREVAEWRKTKPI